MKKFLHGFVYAFNGIILCIKDERNFRFHLAVAFHLFAYLHFFDLNKAEICILIILCALVLALEAVNTAIERVANATEIVSPTIGAAKDAAAGAVLIVAITSLVCGVIILWQPKAFAAILSFFILHPRAIAIQAVALVLCIRFIFAWRSK